MPFIFFKNHSAVRKQDGFLPWLNRCRCRASAPSSHLPNIKFAEKRFPASGNTPAAAGALSYCTKIKAVFYSYCNNNFFALSRRITNFSHCQITPAQRRVFSPRRDAGRNAGRRPYTCRASRGSEAGAARGASSAAPRARLRRYRRRGAPECCGG